jgi:hypothetical protein
LWTKRPSNVEIARGIQFSAILFQVPSKRRSKETADKDEFDMMLDDKEMNKSLSERLGINKKELLKRPSKGGKKKKTKSPWSDSGSGRFYLFHSF